MPANISYSQACENNKAPILAKLQTLLPPSTATQVLEIGSGTGQHAEYFSQQLIVNWQCSDLPSNLPSISARLKQADIRAPEPIAMDIDGDWPTQRYDLIYSANTLHIVSWQQVEALFQKLPLVMAAKAMLVIYGPFNYQGQYTAPSNQQFDQWLKARDPHSGIRDIEEVIKLATAAGLRLEHDFAMPANNRLLVWRRDTGLGE